MIGADGLVHLYPFWLFMILVVTSRRLVRSSAGPIVIRDRQSGRLRILPIAHALLRPLLELPDYRPCRQLRAIDLAYRSGRAKRSGRRGLQDLLACGIDAAVARREAEEAAAALDHTPLPGRARSQLLAEEALREFRKATGPSCRKTREGGNVSQLGQPRR
jgi:hypothetical protein